MNNNERKAYKYALVFNLLIGCIIISLIILQVFFSENRFIITSTTIWLVGLLLLLFAFNIFDSISFGELKLTRKENSQLKKERDDYLVKILNSVSINSYAKSSVTNNIISNATNFDKEQENKIINEEIKELRRNETKQKIEREKKEKEKVLEEYCNSIGINKNDLISVVFSESFSASDPIMNKKVLIDGYYKRNDIDLFIEVRAQSLALFAYIYYLYVKLSKIYYYSKMNNVKAKYVLILYKIDDKGKRINPDDSVIRKYFEPAITNGLLEIITY